MVSDRYHLAVGDASASDQPVFGSKRIMVGFDDAFAIIESLLSF